MILFAKKSDNGSVSGHLYSKALVTGPILDVFILLITDVMWGIGSRSLETEVPQWFRPKGPESTEVEAEAFLRITEALL